MSNQPSSVGIMASVDQRTKLVGQNRMEMLMFRLLGREQLFGINVFKVREVTQCPPLTVIPNSHPVVRGIADFRGTAIPVIDFGMAIGGKPSEDLENALVIISEYNRSVQALIVTSVERIVNLTWESIKAPPAGTRGTTCDKSSGKNATGSFLTAVTEVDGALVEIIDVERVLDEVDPKAQEVSEQAKKELDLIDAHEEEGYLVLIADDSAVARNQLQRCMESMGVHCVAVNDGKQALELLKSEVAAGRDVVEKFLMVISDVEMPVMDGYTLTTEIRFDDALKGLRVVLHTSLSGVFNEALVKKVGANNFIAKFQPDVLAAEVHKAMEEKRTRQKGAA